MRVCVYCCGSHYGLKVKGNSVIYKGIFFLNTTVKGNYQDTHKGNYQDYLYEKLTIRKLKECNLHNWIFALHFAIFSLTLIYIEKKIYLIQNNYNYFSTNVPFK